MTDAIITKAELARELDLSRARISLLSKMGLPVRADGKLNRAEAVAWVKANVCSWRGGWWGDLRKKTGRAGRPRHYHGRRMEEADAAIERGSNLRIVQDP